MPARLIVTRGPETGSQFPLRKRIVTIGRDDGCAIHLDREGVSRNHAQLSLEQGAWSITDLKSRNGTLVNGSRIVEHALTSGDVIGIHDIRLRFEVSDAPPPKAAAGPRELGREDVELVERLRKGREAILGEVRKVIIGQDEVVEQLMHRACSAAAMRWWWACRGWPRRCSSPRSRTASSSRSAHPVHAGPDAVGHHRHRGARGGRRGGRARVQVPPRADLRERRARRRDQPHAAQDAGRPARGDAGVPGHLHGHERYGIDRPFFVLATQNPIEQEGTYPLPEAQLDRFMFSIHVDYPEMEEEVEIVKAHDVARRRGRRARSSPART
jgi:hypothetical protein